MKNYLLFIIVLLFLPVLVRASFVITEIMYDLDGTDAGREWIEIKNEGNESVNLTEWFFFSDNIKHKLVAKGDPIVSPGNFVIVAQNDLNFRTNWPNYSGLLFDSSWTDFNNTSETISIMDGNQKIIDTVTFASTSGAKGNGYSLQKINGAWKESKPTPGTENKLSLNSKPITADVKKTENIKKEEVIKTEGDREISTQSNEVINLNELNVNEKKKIEWSDMKKYYPYLELGIVIILGFIAIYIIRIHEKDKLEEGLSADDIKIIE